MYNNLQLGKKYLQYFLTAMNSKGHGMHSPFAFDFILRVLNNRNHYVPPAGIEKLRSELLKNNTLLQVEDLGAGSRRSSSRQKKIRDLAATALKPKKYGQLLFRLAKHYRPETVIELGTSLGITTAYLAKANPLGKVYTIEGSSEIAAVARNNFQQLEIDNVESQIGNFDDLLPPLLTRITKVDLAYVDGNHRYGPTMNYFHLFLSKCDSDSILVFDDIHWSPEMEQAWHEISNHPVVSCSIDIFFLGFVFFRKEFREKQQFTIRF